MDNTIKRTLILFIASLVRMLRGEVSTNALIKKGLKVGQNFSRQGGVRIDTSWCFLIDIGDNVTLAPNVTALAHDASLKSFLGIARLGRVIIGNDVFIGAGSIILPNVTIGNNVVVGAGSVVTKNIPENTIWAGVPARVICTLLELKNKNLELLRKRPIFDRSFDPLNINESSKVIMKQQLLGGYGFYQCQNYEQIKK